MEQDVSDCSHILSCWNCIPPRSSLLAAWYILWQICHSPLSRSAAVQLTLQLVQNYHHPPPRWKPCKFVLSCTWSGGVTCLLIQNTMLSYTWISPPIDRRHPIPYAPLREFKRGSNITLGAPNLLGSPKFMTPDKCSTGHLQSAVDIGPTGSI